MTSRSFIRFGRLQLALVLLLAFTAASYTTVIEVDFVGNIDDGLFSPVSLAVSGGQLAVLEPFSRQLKVYTPDGVRAELVNLNGQGTGLAQLSESEYLYCDRDRKRIGVVDIENHSTREFSGNGQILFDPLDIIVRDQTVWVLDANQASILEMDDAGHIRKRFRLLDSDGNEIPYPSSFCLNGSRARFYVVNQIDSEIWMFSTGGSYSGRFGSFGNRDGEITRAGEITCGADGLIYVTDRYQNRVVVYDEGGDFVAHIDLYGRRDAFMAVPTGIAVDDGGILYVASTEGASVQIFAVTKPATETAAFHADQLLPADGDTLDASDVALIAQIVVSGSQVQGLTVEFELYDAGDRSSPIQTALVTDELQKQDSEPPVLVAEWRPAAKLEQNKEYDWRIRAVSDSTTGEWTAFRRFLTGTLPGAFRLEQNYPNPFNSETVISFSVPREMHIRIEVINILGQKIAVPFDRELGAGRYNVTWYGADDDGAAAPSGVYFYRLVAGDYMETKKMVLLK